MADNSLQATLQAEYRTLSSGIVAAPKTNDEVQKQTYDYRTQLQELTTALAELKQNKQTVSATVQGYNKQISAATTTENKNALKESRAPYLTLLSGINAQIQEVELAIKILKGAQKPFTSKAYATIDMGVDAVPQTLYKSTSQKVRYNVGSVSDAYFSGKESFNKEIFPIPANTPLKVNNAAELWAAGYANKGMIQPWTPPPSVSVTRASGKDNSSSTNLVGASSSLTNKPHAFQFQYNPGTVSMSYSGTPPVDVTYEMSGQDKFNLVGTNVTQSTIGFQIVINRVYDMKYYSAQGTLQPQAQTKYSPRVPSVGEQKEIYHKGTMYDIEFLLRTILGFTMPSSLRKSYLDNDQRTADMGFLVNAPVELHLGESLRYLVWMNSINLTHVLFNDRMVPLFTTVDVSCSRMPDYGQLSPSAQAAVTPKVTTTTTSDAANNVFDWTGP